MKRKMIVAAALGLQLIVFHPAGAVQAQTASASVFVNGQQVNLQKAPITIQQRTYVGAEDASRILHASWTRSGKQGVLKLGDDRQFTFQLDKGTVSVNGKPSEHGQGAIERDHEVYLPLRWIVEQAGHTIKWNPEKKAVEIMAALKEGGLTILAEDKLTAEERSYVESVKEKQGVHRQGNLYVIARGQSPNPGYGLKITGTQWSWEQLLVYVKQTKPEPGMMYPQVVTYPYLVAKADLPMYTTVVFLDADTNKPLFEK